MQNCPQSYKKKMKHQHFIVYVNTKNGEMLLIRPNKVKGVNRRGDLLETLLPIIFLSFFLYLIGVLYIAVVKTTLSRGEYKK